MSTAGITLRRFTPQTAKLHHELRLRAREVYREHPEITEHDFVAAHVYALVAAIVFAEPPERAPAMLEAAITMMRDTLRDVHEAYAVTYPERCR